jgi:flagellin-like protein
MMFLNKRAMSPLIATILLIAFAVSIGALIMNWTTSPDIPTPTGQPTCGTATLSVISSCADNSNIYIEIKNQGTSPITDVIMNDLSSTKQVDYYIPGSDLNPGQTKEFMISKDSFNTNTFRVIPVISISPDRLVCSSRASSTISLTSC